ncbi:major facilitator superfamily transport protein (plasmid) [Natrialba magadii ATCC 43099]|uniref:Major facilitator superfamily protein n=1 Tax=Natrialba magadii (strain ATCC 43099 / DSM 3394 / CCM 3739 / CIP 104546 / IAM 13178 / JCM 8861 / NBRC 102185 / NCIMB 2190 / MS3) TaxID=547559 RepID=D3T1M1_NATMM|nr:MFS transporter [Natrialba magadii]ADD07480.1 major facilitator superfamily transport protein [Natrialba magadii ATCC 43099]ELY32198.1 major facilitator superfamily protein [Natrialba magadii ATCC 43099]
MVPDPSRSLTALSETVAALRKDGRGSILLALAGGWFLSMGVRMIYPVMLPHLREAYGLDLTTSGLLLTVLFLAYATGQLPGGMLADRIGERTVLTLSTVVAAITLGLVITANSPAILFVATALFGFGTALYAVARYTILPKLYPDRIGAANGVTAASQDAGQSVLPPLAGLIASLFLWQLGFGFVIPLFLLMGAVLWYTVPVEEPETNGEDDSGPLSERIRDLLTVLGQRAVIYPTAVLVLGLCVWQAFTSFYPTYLIEVKDLSTTVSSTLFGLFFALGILIKPLAGGAYDRIGIRRSLVIVASGPAIALLALPFVEGFWPLVGITALVSTLLGFATVTEPYLLETLPEEIRGTGFGILRTIAFMVAALSPVAFGAAADNDFFDQAFMALAVLAGVMLLLAARIPKR